MAHPLFVGAAALVGVLLFAGGVTIYALIQNDKTVSSGETAKCFPEQEGQMLVSVDRAPWFKCQSHCTLEDVDENCQCHLHVSFDGKEGITFPVINREKGLEAQSQQVNYRRRRNNWVQFVTLKVGNYTTERGIVYNNDDIYSSWNCLSDGIRCIKITVQSIHERWLKLRSCSKHPFLGNWDIDDS